MAARISRISGYRGVLVPNDSEDKPWQVAHAEGIKVFKEQDPTCAHVTGHGCDSMSAQVAARLAFQEEDLPSGDDGSEEADDAFMALKEELSS